MLKVEQIIFLDDSSLLCVFNNGEHRILDLKKSLSKNDLHAKKILTTSFLHQAKIGSFGEIYWENAGEIQELNGSFVSCDYDISPEFAYYNSDLIEK